MLYYLEANYKIEGLYMNMNDQYVDILGVTFYNTNRQEFVAEIDNHIVSEDKVFIVTANPEIVMKANEEKDYKQLIDKATYITADGIGIIKAAQLLNKPMQERVTGYDTMMDLLRLSNEKHYSIYLLGAQPETLDKTVAKIHEQFPKIKIAGSHHGYFDWQSPEIRDEIKEKQPDLVFVALGVPRQEQWIAENLEHFQKGIFMGIGGSFDVIAGTVKRAPEIWQKMNLEWFYRLMKQPSRFGRMLALPRFAIHIFKQKVTGKR
jgi:N-acetylglucosaminyldiphosphoundecaprenol N-acetyl-beta-D-mannosaminyltransferase